MQEDFSAVFIRASEQKSTREQLRFALCVFQFEDNDAVPSGCFYLVRKFAHLLCLFNIY